MKTKLMSSTHRVPGRIESSFIMFDLVGPLGIALAETALLVCTNRTGTHGTIHDVYTEEDHRGNGHAREVISSIVTYARENDFYKLTLTCRPGLISFYESFGFVNRSNPEGSESVSMKLIIKEAD